MTSTNKIPMLAKFLNTHRTKDKEEITHTRIGNPELGVYGGSYTIEEKDSDRFWKYYHKHVFVNNKQEFLTEKQMKVGPIAIDLDFRFSPEVSDRQHGNELILDIAELYVEELKNLITIEEDFPIFTFEKDYVNTNNSDVTKDGIHIIMGINIERTIQLMLRDRVLKRISDILEHLPLTNSYEDVIDISIARGSTNWQVFGSRKPGYDAYKIKNIYSYNVEDDSFDSEEFEDDYLSLLKRCSVRNKTNKYYVINESAKDEYDEYKNKEKKPMRANASSSVFSGSLLDFENITNVDELENFVSSYVENLSNEKYEIKETFQFLDLLSAEYYDNYEKWIKVGWALKNTSNELFLMWMLFSSKSSKFNFSEIDGYFDDWKKMKRSNKDYKCLSYKSIRFWAKECNPQEWKRINEETLHGLIEITASGKESPTEYDIARVMHYLWGDLFKCASIQHKLWYKFTHHRWSRTDCGYDLSKRISKDLSVIYVNKTSQIIDVLNQLSEEDDKHNMLKTKAAKFGEIATKLRRHKFKTDVMKQCCELFYDEKFLENLDKNPYLLCFNNGVIDFKNKEFRDGKPEDYLSMTTDSDYIPMELLKKSKKSMKYYDEVDAFLKQLFPVPEVYEYMVEHLASVLIGTNENQTFNLYVGSGRNGKSKLIELMQKVCGKYKGSVPTNLLTSKRVGIGSASPEVAQLQGVRFAVMQEPTKGDTINEGIMKEITGGDPIQGRPLYQSTITFVPQFTLVVCTNNLFEFKSNDDGTWRRIRIIDFISEFRKPEDIDPNEPYQFPVDKRIDERFEDWAPVLTSFLVDKAFETQGNVNDCPEVMKSSYKYREEQDYITQFCGEFIVKDDIGTLKKTELYEEFKMWYTQTYGTKDCPKPKDLYKHINKVYFRGNNPKRWKGIRLVYENEMEEEE